MAFHNAPRRYPTSHKMQPFQPHSLPPSDLDWAGLIPAIGKANRSLARYDGVLQGVPNPAVLLSPMTTQEAVLSSKIEGTRATLGDVLKFEAGQEPKQEGRKEDIAEILNYRRALNGAASVLTTRSFGISMLLTLHKLLLDGVRGQEMALGQFRSKQNWIGKPGSTIEAAVFVPPDPTVVRSHMDAWVAYYHCEQPDPLVQLAIVHAQFEIIHPFDDGNGRLGRILIPLFLFEKQLLSSPMFYLSSWLEKRRDEYVARLRAIGLEQGAWNEWCKFFLRGIDEQAALNAAKATAILKLYSDLKKRVLELTHSQFAVPLLDQMFARPIFQPAHLDFAPLAPSKPAVTNLLRQLREAEVLAVLREGAGRRGTVYCFPALLNLCEGRKAF